MTANGWFQILLFLVLIFLVTKPLGIFMARVFNREKTFLDPALRPVERLLYRATGVDETHEMRWTEYAIAMLLFSMVSMQKLAVEKYSKASAPFHGSPSLVSLPVPNPLVRLQPASQSPPGPTSLHVNAHPLVRPADVYGQSMHMAGVHRRALPSGGPAPSP